MGYDNTSPWIIFHLTFMLKMPAVIGKSRVIKTAEVCPNFISPVSAMGVLYWCVCVCVLPKPGFTLTCVQPSFKSQPSLPSLKQ